MRPRLKATGRPKLKQPLPNREPPTKLLVGPLAAFTDEQLANLESHGLDKVFNNAWIIVFTNSEYKDVDRCITRTNAEAAIRHFLVTYPDLQVTWIKNNKEEPKASKPHMSNKGKKSATFTRSKWLQATKARRAKL